MKIEIINGQLTENFNISEFVDNFSGESELYIDEHFIDFVKILQDFRSWYRRPININSCYRSVECNDYYDGSSNSSHLTSLAVDFNLPKEFARYTEWRQEQFLWNVKAYWEKVVSKTSYFPQVNFYDTYLHLGLSLDHESFIDERSA